MTGPALLALMSHWRQHWFQLGALVIGLAMATSLWVAVQAINTQARASYALAEGFLQKFDQQVLIASDGDLLTSDYVALRRMGWALSPVLEGRIRFGDQSIELIGIDLLTARPIAGFTSQGAEVDPGTFLTTMIRSPGGLILHPQTAAQLATLPPDLKIRHSTEVPPGHAFGDISTVSRLLSEPDKLTRMMYLGQEKPTATQRASLPSHIIFAAKDSAQITPRTLTDSFHLNLTAFGILSFVVGLFIVQGTIGLAMEQRRGLFRTLRCLGVPLRHLLFTLLTEIAVIALISSCIGLILGYFLASSLLPGVSATLSGLYGVEINNGLALRVSWVLSGLAMTLLGAGIASSHAFVTLWKLPILQGTSTQARGQHILRNFGTWARAGTGLLAAGLVFKMTLQGLVGGFALLGCVMLAAALLLPYCLSRILIFGQRQTDHPLAQWLWSDARAQLPGLSLALMALMLALATNIGVGTMVSSFRLTFGTWLDQRLASELYATTHDDTQGAELQRWLEARDIRVLPIRSKVLQQNYGQITIYGVRDDATYRDNWPMLASVPQVWDLLSEGKGILVSEQLAHRQDLSPGDEIPLPAGWPSRVLGIYADYGNPHGQAIVSMSQLLSNAPDAPNQRFGLRLPAEQVPILINEI